jgi:signal transduction histidine kinase
MNDIATPTEIVRLTPWDMDVSVATQDIGMMQSRFIDKVSHEMRTPLTALKLSLGVLASNLPGDASPPLHRLLNNALKSTARLEAAVSDLLDLAKLESGRLQLHLVDGDLAAAVINAAELIRPLAEGKSQELAVIVPHNPCPARFDPARIAQVLLHLLNNAVNYTPVGGSIKVEVRPCAGEYCVYVRDTGCGVTPAAQETIFQRFFIPDGDSSMIDLGGGLGLPLALALVSLHGGCLQVASTGIPGEGSNFYFNLPYTPSHHNFLPNVNLSLPVLSPPTCILVSEQEKTGPSPQPIKSTTAISEPIVRIAHKEEQ